MGHQTRLAKGHDFNRSRAFLYGESVFTTVRVIGGVPKFWKSHCDRLLKSAEWLWPGTSQQAEALIDPLECPATDGIWRLTLSAQATKRALRLDEIPELILDDWWSEEIPPLTPLKARLTPAAPRIAEWPDFLKTGDYLSRLVAARHLNPDEVPLFHVNDHACEFMHANVFFWDSHTFVTPPTSGDALSGIGRERLIELIEKHKLPLKIMPVPITSIESYSGLIAVNAVRGLVPVDSIDSRPCVRHPILESLQKHFFD